MNSMNAGKVEKLLAQAKAEDWSWSFIWNGDVLQVDKPILSGEVCRKGVEDGEIGKMSMNVAAEAVELDGNLARKADNNAIATIHHDVVCGKVVFSVMDDGIDVRVASCRNSGRGVLLGVGIPFDIFEIGERIILVFWDWLSELHRGIWI